MPAKKKKITKYCESCKSPVTRLPSQFPGKIAFCSRTCQSSYISTQYRGVNNPCWRGGRTIETEKGYALIHKPDHPRARKNGYVLEHIIVMEKVLGRPLKKEERIHHINHNPADNKPENLKLYSSNGEHLKQEKHCIKKHSPCKCGMPHKGHGLCTRHLAQLRKTGKTWDFKNKLVHKNRPEFCHCGQPIKARDLCNRHYQQWRKNIPHNPKHKKGCAII